MVFFKNMLFFAYTVFLAVWQEWTAGDIAWSMWASSLFTGGLCIFTAIAFNGLLWKGEVTTEDIMRLVGNPPMRSDA